MKAVFLDRDGVLNKADVIDGKPYAPKSLKDFIILPNVADSLAELKKKGFFLIVVTNQPDVGNGHVEKKLVEKMHLKLLNDLPVDSVKVCYHKQTDECNCRKPKPGMLIEAVSEFGVNLKNSFMVGDRVSDVQAGKAAGCHTLFLDYGYCESEKSSDADYIVKSFSEAVSKIISH